MEIFFFFFLEENLAWIEYVHMYACMNVCMYACMYIDDEVFYILLLLVKIVGWSILELRLCLLCVSFCNSWVDYECKTKNLLPRNFVV